MTKINEDLSPEAHEILRNYQHEHKHNNRGEALNALIMEFAGSRPIPIHKEAVPTYYDAKPGDMIYITNDKMVAELGYPRRTMLMVI